MKFTLGAFAKASSVALACVALAALPCSADTSGQAGRDIAAKWQSAVITLQVVTKVKANFYGEDSTKEVKEETTGVVVDPSGLIVTSLSATNPSEMYMQAMGGDAGDKMKMTSEVTSVKILQQDGVEIPAGIVLRDKDLDLAFVRPIAKPANPMPCVDLTKATKPALLDEVATLDRMGVVANRTLSVVLDRIQAIMEKPRTFYIPSASQSNIPLGAPVFSLQGDIVGVMLLRVKPKGGSSGSYSAMANSLLPVILPAADIAEAAKQAPEKAVLPKPATTAPVKVEPKKAGAK